jgi:predicted secreted hydrolase
MSGWRRDLRDVLLGGLALSLLVACSGEPAVETTAPAAALAEALGGTATEGFLRADRPRRFQFPEDHGVHAGFRNEWWYITGNLESASGERWGFQITFFRVALAPEPAGEDPYTAASASASASASLSPAPAPGAASAWATRHVWMGHAALTDVRGRQHFFTERFAREALGLAGASVPVDRVWLEDWSLAGLADSTWQLHMQVEGHVLDLALQPLRAPVLQGNAGWSQKGREPGNASYYYSIPRVAAQGQLTRPDGSVLPLTGEAWLDREWSTSVLDADQVGWDWFALQVQPDLAVMYYQLRQRDGTPDPLSKGRWMPGDAPDHLLTAEAVQLEALRHARMPSGRQYPVAWRLRIPQHAVDWTIEAVLDAQEVDAFIPYWEGAVDIRDAQGIVGRGFMELTGYD